MAFDGLNPLEGVTKSLKDFPPIIEGIALFPPTRWGENFTVIENTYMSEAGTDIVDVVRYDKLDIDAEFRCRSEWLGTLKAWSKKDRLMVRLYDPVLSEYVTKYMRMRNYRQAPLEFSERVRGTYGVWTVSFTLEEF